MVVVTPSHRFPASGRIVAASALAWLVASAAVCAVGWTVGWPSELTLPLLIGVLSLVVAVIAVIPLRIAQIGGSGAIPVAVLASTVVRLSLTVLLVVGLSEIEMAPRQTIGVWAILWYALLMTAELSSVIRFSVGDGDSDRLIAREPKVQ